MKLTLQNSIQLTKGLISLVCLLLFFIPIGYSFVGVGADELGIGAAAYEWQADYVYTNEMLLLMGPLYLLWGVYLLNIHSFFQKALLLLLFLLSSFYVFLAYIMLYMPIQDYVASWGTLLLGLFFPLILLLGIVEWRAGLFGQSKHKQKTLKKTF